MSLARRIHQLPAADRPREKLRQRGASSLSDFELLEVVIGNGVRGADVGMIARQVQRLLRRGSASLNYESLVSLKGINEATAGKLLAALELARRHLIRDIEPLRSLPDVLARLDDIRSKQQEYLVCMSLDGGQRLVAQRTIAIGTLDAVPAHPREVFADAIADRAASVIIAHNHPSRDVQPSQKDISFTQQLAGAGQLLGVPLRDHIIVSRTAYFSFRQHHLL